MYVILGNVVDDGQCPKHTSLLLQYIIVSTGIVQSPLSKETLARMKLYYYDNPRGSNSPLGAYCGFALTKETADGYGKFIKRYSFSARVQTQTKKRVHEVINMFT